jgi:hypothetical protein
LRAASSLHKLRGLQTEYAVVVGHISSTVRHKNMNKSIWTSAFLGILFVLNLFAQPSDLKLSIIVPNQDNKGANEYQNHKIDLTRADAHFHVLITNISQKQQRIWQGWNSWGWYNLTFEVLDSSGSLIYKLEHKKAKWTVNFPSSYCINPGEQFVIDVYFARKDEWLLPFLKGKKEGEFKVNMRAIYEIPEDKDTKEMGIWTGKIKSEIGKYALQFWKY